MLSAKGPAVLFMGVVLWWILRGGFVLAFEIRSSAFGPEKPIPVKYTWEGEDISVPLAWGEPPQGTVSFTLIADDPDAPMGTWVHWVLYDLPAEARAIEENINRRGVLPDGSKQGVNDFGRIGYGGPCPPPGPVHRYFFKLYALDKKLNLPPRLTKPQILDSMKGHTLAEARIFGTYRR